MSAAIVYSRAQVGIEAPLVTIEVHLSNGLPGLSIVGLPEAAVIVPSNSQEDNGELTDVLLFNDQLIYSR
jgi:hypothetical protein